MTVTLRDATIVDLDAIVHIFLACWRENYLSVLPPSKIAAMTDERARALWQRVLSDNVGDIVVAERTTETGTEILGLTRFAVADGHAGVYSLYVSPDAQGLGVGARLLTSASERLAALGASEATLWVFAANAPSIGFYRKLGWLPDGEERTQVEFGERELRLTRNLRGTS